MEVSRKTEWIFCSRLRFFDFLKESPLFSKFLKIIRKSKRLSIKFNHYRIVKKLKNKKEGISFIYKPFLVFDHSKLIHPFQTGERRGEANLSARTLDFFFFTIFFRINKQAKATNLDDFS